MTTSSTAYEDAIPFPKPKGGKKPRNKGRRAEYKAAKILGTKRTPLSGSSGGGDLISRGLAAGYSVEVKARPSFAVQKFLEQAESDIAAGDNRKPLAFLVPDGARPIICQYAEDWIDRRQQQGPENSYRIRELTRKAKQVLDEIEGLAR